MLISSSEVGLKEPVIVKVIVTADWLPPGTEWLDVSMNGTPAQKIERAGTGIWMATMAGPGSEGKHEVHASITLVGVCVKAPPATVRVTATAEQLWNMGRYAEALIKDPDREEWLDWIRAETEGKGEKCCQWAKMLQEVYKAFEEDGTLREHKRFSREFFRLEHECEEHGKEKSYPSPPDPSPDSSGEASRKVSKYDEKKQVHSRGIWKRYAGIAAVLMLFVALGLGYMKWRNWQEITEPGVEVGTTEQTLKEVSHQKGKIRDVNIDLIKKPEAEEFLNNLGMKFVYINPGTFMMGSPSNESGSDDDEAQHEVTLTRGFYMQTTEVTNGQFVSFLNYVRKRGPKKKPWFETKTEDSHSQITGSAGNFRVESGYNDHPVVNVSWHDANAFAEWLSKKTGNTFQLPTEAEWEYTCRAGTTTPFYFGNTISADQANYGEETMSVGSFPANDFGLYDMHGNVWEWCEDWYDSEFYEKPAAKKKNPLCDDSSSGYCVLRGGSWNNYPMSLRCANRFRLTPDIRNYIYGFRLIRLSQDR